MARMARSSAGTEQRAAGTESERSWLVCACANRTIPNARTIAQVNASRSFMREVCEKGAAAAVTYNPRGMMIPRTATLPGGRTESPRRPLRLRVRRRDGEDPGPDGALVHRGSALSTKLNTDCLLRERAGLSGYNPL